MADQGHTAILKQGVEAWNKWRKENPDLLPDLTGVDFSRGRRGEFNPLVNSLEGQ